MKTRILIMRPDLPHETREVELPDDATGNYAALRQLVEPITGEPMEHVRVFADFTGGTAYKYLDMFVNELGHLSSPPPPRNEAATLIYRRNTLFHEPGKHHPEDMPDIVGPAVLFEREVWK